MAATDSITAIETVFRIEFARLVAGLARYVGDVRLAEELAQDALVNALQQWPEEGTPGNPGAWLMAVGKHKAIDHFRRNANLARKYAQIGRELEGADQPVEADPDAIEDDRLQLIFVACHPVLPVPARVAMTLRLLGGLTTAEIARAYLQTEATLAQRIVRAKQTIAKAQVPFDVPIGEDRARRLGSVLEVIYLIYNEGYSATDGDDWLRPELCTEALRLGRVLAGLAPDEPEVHGLVALMEIQSSRLSARVGPSGEPVLLLDQDRRKWDRLLIGRGFASLNRAAELTSSPRPYVLQAEIAACHAKAFRAEETDWVVVAELYRLLAELTPSPIVELNRAVALAMAYGPAVGLDLVDQLSATGVLDRYQLLYNVRGDLLDKLGRHAEARDEFERSAALAGNEALRRLSAHRAQASAESAAL